MVAVGNVKTTTTVAAAVFIAVTISVFASVLYLRMNKRYRFRKKPKVEVVEDDDDYEDVGEGFASACCSTELVKKPQYRFKRVLAENSYTSFKHFKIEGKESEVSLKLHPYEDDVAFLLEHPPALQDFVTSNECPNMGTSYVWVHTESQLESLAELLSKEKVFAVDTEQHSVRSFLGFTALMQISTQNGDFLLDPIALHDAMSILRPVFANPSICKVFHGADNDVLWLQRDFHIYVVNLFDTAKACMVLSKPQKSLAYLLETYCGVITNKTLQREDWRIRPLSAEMTHYARTDAHYLLYIAYCLVSELKEQDLACQDEKLNFVHEACRRSNTVSMQLYTKEFQSSPGDSAAASIISRYSNIQFGRSLKDDQMRELIRRLCTWRDLMARIHDESLRYVLSDQAIFSLGVKAPKNPTEIYDVILEADKSRDCSNPYSLPSPSPVVEGHLNDICCIFEEITESPDCVFRRILKRYLIQTKTCPLSIYNFALLSNLNIKLSDTLFPKQNGGKPEVPVCRKASRELFVQKFSCKSPVYHNCKIYANDGRLLCYCDQRKLDWYVCRDLAKIVEHDPLAIMLLFEPKGRPEDEDNDFYIQSKKNMCCGCGERNHYLRYRIIPSCYRMHFPEHLKSHRSHDIVLLCVDCHEIAHSAAEKYKKQIAAEFNIPLFVRKVVDSGENKVTIKSCIVEGHEEAGVSPLQLRTAAMALIRHGSKMPSKRHEELMQIVKAYFGGRNISEEDLETALLVGMSPSERRKLEKKRGLPFRSCEERPLCSINTFAVEETSESPIEKNHSLAIFSDSKCSNSEERYLANDISNDDQKNTSAYANPETDILSSPADCNSDSVENMTVEEKLFEQQSLCVVETSNGGSGDYENKVLSDESRMSSLSSRNVSGKYAKRLSLLGHGPHGRQVVDYILKEHGEEGILQFCQRWRQVFVEAIQPRFLPTGWDIMHSGRREFGKYSVYNPSKEAFEVVD